MLTSGSTRYPAALAVRVTTTSADVQVRGVRSVGGVPLSADAVFPMGSITKSMTATLAGFLVQQGRIAWTSRILDVLPELGGVARAEYATVTLADLLAHRGGIFPAVTPEQVALLPPVTGTATAQRLQLAAWALQRAPSVAPRTRTDYSNGGFIIAGAMLERVAGEPYEVLLQSKVFAPLGQVVAFGTTGSAAGEPWGHMARPGGAWVAVDPADPAAQFPAFANPAGGAKLSGAALGRYLQLHLRALRGSRGELLTPETAAYLHTVVQDDLALGWQAGKDLEGRPLDWHNGSDDVSYYGLVAVGRAADVAAGVVVSGVAANTEADTSAVTVRMMR